MGALLLEIIGTLNAHDFGTAAKILASLRLFMASLYH